MMMLKTRKDFVRRAGTDAKTADAATARMEREIQRLFKSYNAQVKALIRNPSILSKSQTFDLAVAQRVINDLSRILVDAGRDDVVGAYLDEFPDLHDQARSYFKQFGDLPDLGGASEESLAAYVEFTTGKFVQSLDAKLIGPLEQGLFQATFGNMPRETVVETIVSLADNLTETQAITLVDDSFRQFQRGVTNLTAEELGMEVFWYQGPDDEITSDQCQHILTDDPHGVEGMYYRDEISIDMHEKLRADPFVAGGHPNCRHKFYPVTLDFAKEQGFRP
jgi:hypothetical protein